MGNGTSIGRVRGLGAAHHGAHHWLLQRFTAAGNLLTCIYLAVSLVLLPDMAQSTVLAWMAQPFTALVLALLLISTIWHARLGLQVLFEDYVHEAGSRFAVLLLLNIAAFAGVATGLFFILRIVLLAMGQDQLGAIQSAMSAAGAAR
ncbi:MAG: succinate dehydrogenase, hydrophobic membrane anchor protein [Croceibacterium sp.]